MAKRKNSRAKGARGEREAAAYLTKLGFPAERNARNGLSTDDLVIPSLPGVHIEVKRSEAIGLGTKALRDAIAQAESNAGARRAFVLWKNNGCPWCLTRNHNIYKVPITFCGDSDIQTILSQRIP